MPVTTTQNHPRISPPILTTLFGNALLSKGLGVASSIKSNSQLAHFVTNTVSYLLSDDNSPVKSQQQYLSFKQFVERALTATNVTSSAVILSLKYIHRLGMKVPLLGNSGSEYRIWLTSIMLADCFLNDNAFTTASWAEVSGFSIGECCTMRREFLNAISFELAVDTQEYIEWLNFLEERLSYSIQHYRIQQNQLRQHQLQQQTHQNELAYQQQARRQFYNNNRTKPTVKPSYPSGSRNMIEEKQHCNSSSYYQQKIESTRMRRNSLTSSYVV